MSKLFVALIFAAFVINCDHEIEVVATESNELTSTTTVSGSTSHSTMPTITEAPSTNESTLGNTSIDGSSPIADAQSKSEIHTGHAKVPTVPPLKPPKQQINPVSISSGELPPHPPVSISSGKLPPRPPSSFTSPPVSFSSGRLPPRPPSSSTSPPVSNSGKLPKHPKSKSTSHPGYSSLLKLLTTSSTTSISNIGDSFNGESPSISSSTSISNIDSTLSSSYEPLILIVKKDKTNSLFAENTNTNIISFSNVKIVSEKQSTNQLELNEEKVYLCPQGTMLEKLGGEYEQYRNIALFQKNFGQDEAHQCSTEPQYIVRYDSLDSDPTNCIKRLGLELRSLGVVIGYPLIKKEIVNEIEKEVITVASRMMKLYQLCYDNQRKKTYWIIREITPQAQVERDLEKQKELYTKEYNYNSETIFHKIVPSEENSFKMWERATSKESNNYVLVWLKLKPLIDLIDERLEKYSTQVSRSIKVMTKLVYNENVSGEEDAKQKENLDYWRPELLLIQAYDEDEKSAITFVIHNSLENPPEGSPFCNEPVKCNFMTWFETPSIFEEYINDDVTKFAYCCRSTILYEMLANTEKVMDINWNSASPPTM